MLIIGLRARRALCMLASPLARPGPVCSSVAAGPIGHARIAVGGTGHHAFEQAEHATHLRFAVKRGNEMHFGRAGVGEADRHIIGQKHVTQDIGAIHEILSRLDDRREQLHRRAPAGQYPASTFGLIQD